MSSDESKALITTVIPTYRRPELLQGAIKSVLDQTFSRFKICVYDNASGDDTPAIVSDFSVRDKRVKYYCQEKNIGAIGNFNYGIQQVNTPFFSLLSDDNLLLPGFFEKAIQVLTLHPDAVFFAGKTIILTENGDIRTSSLQRWRSGLVAPPGALLDVYERGLPTWESILFRSDIIDSVGLLNPVFRESADQDFIMRIARRHAFYVSHKPCALFLSHNQSRTAMRHFEDRVYVIKKMAGQWIEDNGLPKTIKKGILKASEGKITASLTAEIINKCLLKGDIVALSSLWSILKKNCALSSYRRFVIKLSKNVCEKASVKRTVLFFYFFYKRVKDKIFFTMNKKKHGKFHV